VRIVDDDPAIRPVLADVIREAATTLKRHAMEQKRWSGCEERAKKQQVHEPCSKPINVTAVFEFVGHNITGAAKD